jgi:hypothetical protein
MPREDRDGHAKAGQVHRSSGTRSPATIDPGEDEQGKEAAKPQVTATRLEGQEKAEARLEAP